MTVILLVLSLLHLPIITFGDDSIGLFDLVFALLFLYHLIYVRQIKEFFSFFAFLFFIYLCLLSTIIIVDELNAFHWLFIIKQIQFLTISIVWYIHLQKDENIKYFVFGIFLISLITSFYGFYGMISGQYLRLALINKVGYSPNPASFILSICILTILFYGEKYQKYLLFIPIIALLLTFSRTNSLALLITLIFWSVINARLVTIILTVFSIILVVGIFSFLRDFLPPEFIYHKTLFIYITNPIEIINDPSFQMRVTLWISEFSNNFIKLLIGKGVGSVEFQIVYILNYLLVQEF